jgi:hypothetical protein
MTIVNVGVSHRIAAAEVLEKLAVPSARRGSVRAKQFSADPDGPVYLDALSQLFDLPTGQAGT